MIFSIRQCLRIKQGASLRCNSTTPNTIEFSEWIGRTKQKPVHVIRTNYRPVPLSHNLWAGLKLHSIMEGRDGFNPKGYAEAGKALLPASVKKAADDKAKGGVKSKSTPAPPKHQTKPGQQQGSKQDWLSLARFLEREGLMPTVVFSFSKKKCEEIANMLRSLVSTLSCFVNVGNKIRVLPQQIHVMHPNIIGP